jgi:hypothetical protein
MTGRRIGCRAGHGGRRRGTILVTGAGLALTPQDVGAVPALAAGKAAAPTLVLAAAAEFAAQGVHPASVTIAGQVAPGGP